MYLRNSFLFFCRLYFHEKFWACQTAKELERLFPQVDTEILKHYSWKNLPILRQQLTRLKQSICMARQNAVTVAIQTDNCCLDQFTTAAGPDQTTAEVTDQSTMAVGLNQSTRAAGSDQSHKSVTKASKEEEDLLLTNNKYLFFSLSSKSKVPTNLPPMKRFMGTITDPTCHLFACTEACKQEIQTAYSYDDCTLARDCIVRLDIKRNQIALDYYQ